MIRTSAAEISDMLAGQIETLSVELVGAGPTSRTRDSWRFRSRGSLAVVIAGQKRGSWYDHEAGQGGDALDLVSHLRAGSLPAAYAWAVGWLGLAGGEVPRTLPQPRPVPRQIAPEQPSTAAMAHRLWSEGVAPAGTLVEHYLRSRGLALPSDAPLRFHPRAWRNSDFGPPGPAMLARMTDAETGEATGTHVTYLRPDGTGKAEGERKKIMLGNAGLVRLVPDEEVAAGLGLAEGVETSLAVMQHAGWAPVWAACSAGGIARFPVLPGIETLTVFADADDRGAGLTSARSCASRWQEAGREVRVMRPPVGLDFHDALREAA